MWSQTELDSKVLFVLPLHENAVECWGLGAFFTSNEQFRVLFPRLFL